MWCVMAESRSWAEMVGQQHLGAFFDSLEVEKWVREQAVGQPLHAFEGTEEQLDAVKQHVPSGYTTMVGFL